MGVCLFHVASGHLICNISSCLSILGGGGGGGGGGGEMAILYSA